MSAAAGGGASAPVRPGEVIAGKYRVERKLGAGAMGLVVSATHLQLEQRVAIKLMLDAPRARPDLVARFVREGRAAAKIKGEHVARVLDVGELEGGAPYIVMEYLEGLDLAALLKREGPMEAERVVGYLLEACEALAEAHALGIVHRDLKPANLFLAKQPDGSQVIKVLDFGVSKTGGDLAASGLGLTAAEAMLGSPLYTSPEQLRSSREADARSDLWSLGVILYELLAGRTPFRGEVITELVVDIMLNPPPPIGRADVPPELEAAVVRCLSRAREERFGDVAELAAALAPFGPPGAEEAAERVARVLYPNRPRSLPPPRSTPPRSGRAAATSGGPTARSIEGSARSDAPGPPPGPAWRGLAMLVGFGGALAGLVAIVTLALLRPGAPRVSASSSVDLASARPAAGAPSAAAPPRDPPAAAPTLAPPSPAAAAPEASASAAPATPGRGASTAKASAKASEPAAAAEGPGKRPPRGHVASPPTRPTGAAARPPAAAPTAFDMPIK
ncbi:MAG TPA: serine/threonine-protein kinase [Polyangiaceae bacterium]|nr:serine/threonine-protein kinase [Polyangiaceae bacterium]